jgi:hypothetical protein
VGAGGAVAADGTGSAVSAGGSAAPSSVIRAWASASASAPAVPVLPLLGAALSLGRWGAGFLAACRDAYGPDAFTIHAGLGQRLLFVFHPALLDAFFKYPEQAMSFKPAVKRFTQRVYGLPGGEFGAAHETLLARLRHLLVRVGGSCGPTSRGEKRSGRLGGGSVPARRSARNETLAGSARLRPHPWLRRRLHHLLAVCSNPFIPPLLKRYPSPLPSSIDAPSPPRCPLSCRSTRRGCSTRRCPTLTAGQTAGRCARRAGPEPALH